MVDGSTFSGWGNYYYTESTYTWSKKRSDNIALYPTKSLKDYLLKNKDEQPFIPFNTLESVLVKGVD